MSARDDTSQIPAVGREPGAAGSRSYPLDPEHDVVLFIGEPPTGTEQVAGVSASESADPEKVAAWLRHAAETAARIERVGERLQIDVEQFLEAIETMADGRELPPAAAGAESQLSAHEEAALREMGLLRGAPLAAGATPPSAAAALRYAELLTRTLSVKDAAARLGVTEGRIRQRLGNRTLYGISTNRGWRLPEFQFGTNGTLPGFERVLPELGAGLHPLAVEGFFTRRQPGLDFDGQSVSPLEWLAAGGDPAIVAELAGDLLLAA